jgi:hypothetical protein
VGPAPFRVVCGLSLVGTAAVALTIGLAAGRQESQRTARVNAALEQSNGDLGSAKESLEESNAKLETGNARLKTANSALEEVNSKLEAEKRRAFVTALNKRLGAGVTPENNANVLIWKAIGPQRTVRDHFITPSSTLSTSRG